MFTPTPNAFGSILFGIDAMTNVITVDNGLYANLSSALGIEGTGHTYLRIGAQPGAEYIRVQYVSGIDCQIVVDRGIDGTTPRAYPAGTRVEYTLTAEAIHDITRENMGLVVTLTAQEPLRVNTTSTNQFHLTLDPLNLTSPNNSVDIVGDWPDIQLSTNPNQQGCR